MSNFLDDASQERVITRAVDVKRSARVLQLEGIFDVPPAEKSEKAWTVKLPLNEKPWNVGLIVGPSGAGKSTVAKELFGDHLVSGYDWPSDAAIVDAFPKGMSIREITELLSSVGFSSPPSWLRPFRVLSNGEQFRVTMARALAEGGDVIVVDEFTSVIDRTVAQIGSAAIARTIRKRNQKFVAVGCHYDVVEWLQPDWIFEPHTGEFQWRCLRRRPEIELTIRRVDPAAWHLFKDHHYLTSALNPVARCFVAFIGETPVAFHAMLPFPHPRSPGWRSHRVVCLPDYQGVGIGHRLCEYVCSLFAATGKPVFATSANPALIAHRAKSPLWLMHRAPKRLGLHRAKDFVEHSSYNRLTAGFRYVGKPAYEEARAFGILK